MMTKHLPVLSAIWRWWIGELAALVPARLRRGLAGTRGRLVLVIGGQGVAELMHESTVRHESLGAVDLLAAPPAEAGSAFRAMTQGRELAVRLPADAALRTTISLPLAAERNLAQVVSFELERRTPLKRSETYHGFRVLRLEHGTKRLIVELCVAPRQIVDDMLAALARLGVEPRCVEVAGADRSETVSPNLLPGEAGRRMTSLPGLALGVLSLAVVLLGGAAVAVPLYRAHAAVDLAAAEVADAKRKADESQRLQTEIDAALNASGFLGTRKHSAPAISEVLDGLTRLLPDDTWLTELQVKGTDVEIVGQSSSASALIGLIDRSSDFASPSFRSPVTQDQRSNHEQFDIAAHIVRGDAP